MSDDETKEAPAANGAPPTSPKSSSKRRLSIEGGIDELSSKLNIDEKAEGFGDDEDTESVSFA